MSLVRVMACVAAVLIGSAAPLDAHPAPFSYLDVRLEPSAVDVTLVVHVLDIAHDLGLDEAVLVDPATLAPHSEAVVRLLRSRLRLSVDGQDLPGGDWSVAESVPDRHALRVRARHPIVRPAGRVTIDAHLFPYDPAHQTFVNIYEGEALTAQMILAATRRQAEYFAGTRQGVVAVVQKFLPSGIHHILIGPDHLLFLVGLLLLGGSLRQLILVVSAFTLAHSVTLSLAALDIVSPPAWVVEPAIALSIIYVGADNLTVRGGRDMRAWIAFAFGLVHGFGFASVLREMELPSRALGWSLFSFNLGVEVGQIIVVLAVASVLAFVRTKSEVAARRVAVAGSVVVIAAGAFWFIERVFV